MKTQAPLEMEIRYSFDPNYEPKSRRVLQDLLKEQIVKLLLELADQKLPIGTEAYKTRICIGCAHTPYQYDKEDIELMILVQYKSHWKATVVIASLKWTTKLMAKMKSEPDNEWHNVYGFDN